MSAEQDLDAAYLEWRRLAESEGQAIQACNWSLLSACQKALANLQQRITQLSRAAKAEWEKSGAARKAKEKKIHATIHELIALEQRNDTLLKSVRQNALQQLEQLDRAGHNLKRIHRSYSGESPLAWTSYS